MKDLKLKITINKSASEAFEFTTNPANTPLWVDSIKEEKTNEWPVRLGTIYKNRGESGVWGEYKITEFEKDKMFTFSALNSAYHVRYIFTMIDANSCELEYYEWVDEGELEDPFTVQPLNKLKEILESRS